MLSSSSPESREYSREHLVNLVSFGLLTYTVWPRGWNAPGAVSEDCAGRKHVELAANPDFQYLFADMMAPATV
jgi:hypothetical protein